MAEYGSWPIWPDYDGMMGAIPPEELPISKELVHDINAWDNKFQATFDDNYPPDSAFKTIQEEKDFIYDGEKLRWRLQQELGNEFEVTYIISMLS